MCYLKQLVGTAKRTSNLTILMLTCLQSRSNFWLESFIFLYFYQTLTSSESESTTSYSYLYFVLLVNIITQTNLICSQPCSIWNKKLFTTKYGNIIFGKNSGVLLQLQKHSPDHTDTHYKFKQTVQILKPV